MKTSLQFSVLLSMLLSAACMAAEPSMCKSICAEEKRECRSSARDKTELDHDPVFGNAETGHRDARALGKLQSTPQDAKANERSDFEKRRREREQVCDSKAMACSRACTSPAPESMVKPRTQQ
jgi:hypothetical protein